MKLQSLEEITRDLILTVAYYDHMVARVIYRDFERLCALRNKPITSVIERENEFNGICDEIIKGFLLLDRDIDHDGDPFLGYSLSEVFIESYKDDWAESVGLTV